MTVNILILVIAAAILAIISGIWVAIALLRTLRNGRTDSPEQPRN